MKCSKCPYYKCCPNSNECELLHFEYYREIDDCKIVNNDGTINEIEYEKLKKYM
ncbi:hypothetical protein CBC_0710 [Clostridium botulinum C str. Eklund]|nr:hypothetical protein CBC_0710 [Clostridium botulinum C str. Eklund]